MPRTTKNIRHHSAGLQTSMLVGDSSGSVLATITAGQRQLQAYSPYGVHYPQAGGACLLAFNGARPEPATGHYLLGNGYRAFNPALMRFNSPDSLSPFGRGGLNAYGYVSGDPVNRTDPTGHFSLRKLLRRMLPRALRSRSHGVPVPPQPSNTPSQPPSSAQKHSRVLTNIKPEMLEEELRLLNRSYAATGIEPRRLITDPSHVLSDRVGIPQKFVMTADGQMASAVSGEKGADNYISHPAIAALIGNQPVISAGTMVAGSMGDVLVHNWSGHFRPLLTDLQPAVKYIRNLGLEPQLFEFNTR